MNNNQLLKLLYSLKRATTSYFGCHSSLWNNSACRGLPGPLSMWAAMQELSKVFGLLSPLKGPV